MYIRGFYSKRDIDRVCIVSISVVWPHDLITIRLQAT